jgi:hypothetical protein
MWRGSGRGPEGIGKGRTEGARTRYGPFGLVNCKCNDERHAEATPISITRIMIRFTTPNMWEEHDPNFRILVCEDVRGCGGGVADRARTWCAGVWCGKLTGCVVPRTQNVTGF